MQQLEWVIPVVFLVIWFISHLLRNNEEERAVQNRRRMVQRSAVQEQTPPVVLTEIDRFLSEVNRRRQQALERQGTARQKPPLAKQTKPPKARLTSSRPSVVDVPPPSFPKTETATSSLVNESASLSSVPVLEAAAPAGEPGTPSMATLFSPTPRTAGSLARTPGAEELLALLSNAQSLRTAFILKEVFGSPRAVHRWNKRA